MIKMFRRTFLTWIYIFFINQKKNVLLAVSVDDFGLSDGTVPEKGSDITIKCNVTISASDGIQTLNVLKGAQRIADCILYVGGNPICSMETNVSPRYTVTYNQSSVLFTITNLQRSDGGEWYCGFAIQTSYTLFQLTVYSTPVGFVFYGKDGGDLQTEDVTLHCQTSNCVYPSPPQFQWLYKKMNTTTWLLYQNMTPSGNVASCSNSERIYSATLHLPRYTVWPLQPVNTETAVKFQCRLEFPTLQSALQSAESGNVVYAVKVTAVTLKDGNRTPSSTDTVEVITGSPKTLACTPSTSRPAATIVWYIGSTVKQRSTNTEYTYTPVYADHNKRIYCKAFNIQDEPNAVSSNMPVLNVQTKVTSVTLYDGSSSPGSSDEIIVTENQVKKLTCRTGDSNPVATIVWYINDQIKQNGTGRDFVFTPTNTNHGKRIYCKAYNVQSPEEAVSSASPKLYVRVLARTPSLTNWTSGNPEFLSGEEVTLKCRSTPTRPVVSVVWRKRTVPLGNIQNSESTNSDGLVIVMSKVTFTPRNSDNGTTVSCETSVTNQNPQKAQHNILVWWPPLTPIIPENSFPWLEGKNGKQLRCESGDYGNPVADVVWTTSVGTPTTTMLNFPSLTKYYHGMNVTCQLKNKYTERFNRIVKSQTVQLDIQYKPDVFIYIDNVERYSVVKNEGQSLTAVCSARGNPVPTVTWQGQAPGNTQLVFTDIDRKDHGDYRCTAKASSSNYPSYDFSNETTLDVIVNYAPNVSVDVSHSDPVENGSLLISCNAVGRPATYTYMSMVQTWKGVEIKEQNTGNGIIEIKSVQLQDSGTYTCTVNNGVKDRNQQLDQTGTRNIRIKVSPKVLLEGTYTFAGAVGTSVNITVPFFCYPEIHTVVFKRETGPEIVNSSKYEVFYRRQNVSTKFYGKSVELEGYVAVLHIKDEEVSDFVNYTLTLQNDIGPPKTWVLEHVSESKPSAPEAFSITGISHGVPTFSFVGGFNGGRIQTFIVETAIFSTENWKEQIRFNETDKEFLKDDKLTFRFNITGLAPNTYDMRILSENSIDRIDEELAPSLRFTIEKTGDEPNKGMSAAIIGGVFAGLVVVVGVVVAFVIIVIKRRGLSRKDKTPKSNEGKKLEERMSTETSYYNLTFQGNTEPSELETTCQYETLQKHDATDPLQVYEKLRVPKEDRISPHASPVAGHSVVTKVTTGGDKIYENLKLDQSAQST